MWGLTETPQAGESLENALGRKRTRKRYLHLPARVTASALYASPLKEEGERRTGWYNIGWWWSLPGEDPSDAMEVNGEARGEFIINEEDAIEGVPDP